MDPNDGPRNESVPDGLLEAVATANHETFSKQGRSDRNAKDPAQNAEITGAQNTHKTKQNKNSENASEATEDPDEEENAGDNAEGLDTQDFSRQPSSSEDNTDNNEATGEPSQTNTETNTQTDDEWKKSLPSPPATFQLQPPKPDELGQIDPVEYTNYVTEKAKAEIRQESYNQLVITRSFEEAEKVLPELKTNPDIQALVRDSYLSQIGNGDPTVVVQIAQRVKSLLNGKKAEGVNNAKTSITIQKNAAVETKSPTQKKAPKTKSDQLNKRLAKNDTSAFEELMSGWMDEGKV